MTTEIFMITSAEMSVWVIDDVHNNCRNRGNNMNGNIDDNDWKDYYNNCNYMGSNLNVI